MAYNFTKLSEATLVDSTNTTPNILIEDGGDIKRISADDIATPQVKADWNETDVTSPAFILNKPESLGGGGANVVSYTLDSGALMLDGAAVTAQAVVDEWNNGSIMRIDSGTKSGMVVSISYTIASGSVSGSIYYLSGSGITTVTL